MLKPRNKKYTIGINGEKIKNTAPSRAAGYNSKEFNKGYRANDVVEAMQWSNNNQNPQSIPNNKKKTPKLNAVASTPKMYATGTSGVEAKGAVRYTQAGKVVKRAAPIAQPYMSSDQIPKGTGGNMLSQSGGYKSSAEDTRDISSHVAGAGMVDKSTIKKLKDGTSGIATTKKQVQNKLADAANSRGQYVHDVPDGGYRNMKDGHIELSIKKSNGMLSNGKYAVRGKTQYAKAEIKKMEQELKYRKDGYVKSTSKYKDGTGSVSKNKARGKAPILEMADEKYIRDNMGTIKYVNQERRISDNYNTKPDVYHYRDGLKNITNHGVRDAANRRADRAELKLKEDGYFIPKLEKGTSGVNPLDNVDTSSIKANKRKEYKDSLTEQRRNGYSKENNIRVTKARKALKDGANKDYSISSFKDAGSLIYEGVSDAAKSITNSVAKTKYKDGTKGIDPLSNVDTSAYEKNKKREPTKQYQDLPFKEVKLKDGSMAKVGLDGTTYYSNNRYGKQDGSKGSYGATNKAGGIAGADGNIYYKNGRVLKANSKPLKNGSYDGAKITKSGEVVSDEYNRRRTAEAIERAVPIGGFGEGARLDLATAKKLVDIDHKAINYDKAGKFNMAGTGFGNAAPWQLAMEAGAPHLAKRIKGKKSAAFVSALPTLISAGKSAVDEWYDGGSAGDIATKALGGAARSMTIGTMSSAAGGGVKSKLNSISDASKYTGSGKRPKVKSNTTAIKEGLEETIPGKAYVKTLKPAIKSVTDALGYKSKMQKQIDVVQESRKYHRERLKAEAASKKEAIEKKLNSRSAEDIEKEYAKEHKGKQEQFTKEGKTASNYNSKTGWVSLNTNSNTKDEALEFNKKQVMKKRSLKSTATSPSPETPAKPRIKLKTQASLQANAPVEAAPVEAKVKPKIKLPTASERAAIATKETKEATSKPRIKLPMVKREESLTGSRVGRRMSAEDYKKLYGPKI